MREQDSLATRRYSLINAFLNALVMLEQISISINCWNLSISSGLKGPHLTVHSKIHPLNNWVFVFKMWHYNGVKIGAMASQITSLTIVYSTVCSDADKKNQSFVSLAFARGLHRWPVNSPHKWPAMRKMFPFDDVIMINAVRCKCKNFQ